MFAKSSKMFELGDWEFNFDVDYASVSLSSCSAFRLEDAVTKFW